MDNNDNAPAEPRRENLEAYWMPFTANRQFKSKPRLVESARGMHYITDDGRRVLDGTAGLWCTNLGHGRKRISDAVSGQIQRINGRVWQTSQRRRPIKMRTTSAVDE